jgi:DNA-binding MarR family transcriptional regulator
MKRILYEMRNVGRARSLCAVTSSQQPNPRPAIQDLYIELLAFNRTTGRLLGLSDSDLAALDLVHRAGRITPTELARRTHTHPATMTGILKRLEKGGWITRTRPDEDRRAVVIAIQPDREKQIQATYSRADDVIDSLNQATSPADLAAVEAYARAMAAAIREVHRSE